MTEQPAPYRPNPTLKRIEDGFESLIFNSRWLMAPFYFGLVVSLAVLLLKFCMILWGRASGVRGVGLHARDLRPLERRRSWGRVGVANCEWRVANRS